MSFFAFLFISVFYKYYYVILLFPIQSFVINFLKNEYILSAV